MNNFIKDEIINRAISFWDNKTELEKNKTSKKYSHLFKNNLNWNKDFKDLAKEQQIILIKGEVIRTYDSLPNIEKTKIMRKFSLSQFSSKWYKLNSQDKNILMKYII